MGDYFNICLAENFDLLIKTEIRIEDYTKITGGKLGVGGQVPQIVDQIIEGNKGDFKAWIH